MKIAVSLFMVLMVSAVIFTETLFSQDIKAIEIKGLRIGMTKEEIESTVGKLPLNNLTIAGVRGKDDDSTPVIIKFHEGVLDLFMFRFDPGYFDDILGAVKTKYPTIRCENSTVTNAMGASFKQVDCKLKDQSGSLSLIKFGSDIMTSRLSLISDRWFKETAGKQKEKQKDL